MTFLPFGSMISLSSLGSPVDPDFPGVVENLKNYGIERSLVPKYRPNQPFL